MPGISPSVDRARQKTEGGILRLRGCRPEPPPKRRRLKVSSVVNLRPPSPSRRNTEFNAQGSRGIIGAI